MGKEGGSTFQKGIEDYLTRIQKTFSAAIVSDKKGQTIRKTLNRLRGDDYLIGLAQEGKTFTSSELATYLQMLIEQGTKEIYFLVGDADGLEPDLQEKCNLLLSLSRMTFSHRLARLVLLEQVYRALSIIQNTPYHR